MFIIDNIKNGPYNARENVGAVDSGIAVAAIGKVQGGFGQVPVDFRVQ